MQIEKCSTALKVLTNANAWFTMQEMVQTHQQLARKRWKNEIRQEKNSIAHG